MKQHDAILVAGLVLAAVVGLSAAPSRTRAECGRPDAAVDCFEFLNLVPALAFGCIDKPAQPGDQAHPDRREPDKGRDGGRRGLRETEALTDKEIDEHLAFLKKHFPDRYQRLDTLRKKDERRFRWFMGRTAKDTREMIDAMARCPKVGRLKIEESRIRHLIYLKCREYRSAGTDTEKKEKIKGEIAAKLREQFDIRQDQHKAEIEELRRRLTKQQEELESRTVDKDGLVAKRLEELLRPPSHRGRHGSGRDRGGDGDRREGRPRPPTDK